MNVASLLHEAASRFPEAPAFAVERAFAGVPEGRVYTLDELSRIVGAIAARAIALGLEPGDRVRLVTRDNLPLFALGLGLGHAGIVTCSTNVEDVAAQIVVGSDQGERHARSIAADPSWWTPSSRDGTPSLHPGGDAVFTLQPTSGTSGTPKSIPITHAQKIARIRARAVHGPAQGARTLCTIGSGAAVGLQFAVRAMITGGMAIFPSRTSDIGTLIDRRGVNFFVATPNAISALLTRLPAGAPRPASLEQVILTGAYLSAALIRSVAERLCGNVYCLYGSTEAGPIAIGPAQDMRAIDGACGFLLPGVDVEAVDAAGRPMPRGSVGALRMRSESLASGYFEDPQATSRVFRDGWYYPGDVGMLTADGILVIQGRHDDLINFGGHKIAPEAIEEVLRRVPGVVDAAAFGVPDDLGRSVVHAAIVCEGDLGVETIQQAFRGRREVPRPTVVLRVPRLPYNDNGKVARRALVDFVLSMPGRKAT